MQLKRSKRPFWEYGIVILVVAVSLLLSVALYAKRDQVFKERLMIWELLTLRNYVIAYMLEHQRLPSEQSEREGEAPTALLLEGATRAPKIDPFGYLYRYHPQTGWVSSATPGYQHW